MKKIMRSSAVVAALLLTACASQTNWTPTVDPYNDANAYRIPQDTAECKQLAAQASGGTTRETVTGAAVGGLAGAAGGAALGAITGNPGAGAAWGAAIGGLGGAAKQGFSAEDKYKNAFNSCMRGRGHHPL
jgi:uncharacterized protein YcfJ